MDDNHTAPAPRPKRPPEPLWENFPTALTVRRQWVLWTWQFAKDRWTKVPAQPNGCKKASVTDPKTWASFEDVQCAYLSPCTEKGEIPFDGVGFVLTAADPFVAFDFDHCRNPETGEIDPLIVSYIARLDSYTEISPSSTGIRVIVEARLPPQDRRVSNVEVYFEKRFVSITGQKL